MSQNSWQEVRNLFEMVLKGLPISDDNKAKLMSARTQIYNAEADKLAELLYTGKIDIPTWQKRLQAEIKGLHASLAAIGKGGWDDMTSQDWGRLGTPLRTEYKFLRGFADHIAENRDNISLRYIQSRSKLYAAGGKYAAVINQTPLYIYDLLPFMPKDGSTECYHNCRCYWKLTTIRTENYWNIVRCDWIVNHDEERCNTCLSRTGYSIELRIPDDVKIPAKIGGF